MPYAHKLLDCNLNGQEGIYAMAHEEIIREQDGIRMKEDRVNYEWNKRVCRCLRHRNPHRHPQHKTSSKYKYIQTLAPIIGVSLKFNWNLVLVRCAYDRTRLRCDRIDNNNPNEKYLHICHWHRVASEAKRWMKTEEKKTKQKQNKINVVAQTENLSFNELCAVRCVCVCACANAGGCCTHRSCSI